jgi:hypothetical protein
MGIWYRCYVSIYNSKIKFLAVNIEGPFGRAPASAFSKRNTPNPSNAQNIN